MSYRPSYEAISASAPSPFDLACSQKLHRFMAEASPQLSQEEQLHRMNIMSSLTAIFEDWVRSVCLSQGLPPDVAAS